MPLLEFLALNEHVALLPLTVAFSIGEALKGGERFEGGHEEMDSDMRE